MIRRKRDDINELLPQLQTDLALAHMIGKALSWQVASCERGLNCLKEKVHSAKKTRLLLVYLREDIFH